MILDADRNALSSGKFSLLIPEARIARTLSSATKIYKGTCRIDVDTDGLCKASGAFKSSFVNNFIDAHEYQIGHISNSDGLRIDGTDTGGRKVVATASHESTQAMTRSPWVRFECSLNRVDIIANSNLSPSDTHAFHISALIPTKPPIMHCQTIYHKGEMPAIDWALEMDDKWLRANVNCSVEISVLEWHRLVTAWLFPVCGIRAEPRAIEILSKSGYCGSIFPPYFSRFEHNSIPLLRDYQYDCIVPSIDICTKSLLASLNAAQDGSTNATQTDLPFFLWQAFSQIDIEYGLAMSSIAVEAIARHIYSSGDFGSEDIAPIHPDFFRAIKSVNRPPGEVFAVLNRLGSRKIGIKKLLSTLAHHDIISEKQVILWDHWRHRLLHGSLPNADMSSRYIALLSLQQAALQLYAFAIGVEIDDVSRINQPFLSNIIGGLATSTVDH